MPPKKAAAAAAVSSDSDGSSCDDDDLTWQDDIEWEHYDPTRGLNPSLCVRTRILISMAAARMVTQKQRRECWTAVGDFPIDERRVLDAMGVQEPGTRKSQRNCIKNAAEQIRDIIFSSDTSDGGLLRRVKRIASDALCAPQFQAIGLAAKVNKPAGKKRASHNKTQQGNAIYFGAFN